MIEVKKGPEPEGLTQLRNDQEIKKLRPRDAFQMLRNPLKREVTDCLKKEQGHLCVYCMSRIPREDKDPGLVALTKELTETLRKNKTIDWQKRDAARARMRMMIKKLLKKYKYPPEGMEDALETVMLQCELWTDNSDLEEHMTAYAEAFTKPSAQAGSYTYLLEEDRPASMAAEEPAVYGHNHPDE